jgi:anti-sigma-K factor RskA
MNLTKYPDTLDRIAASYALGSLRGGARRRFEAMARVQAPVRAAALVWQTRFAAMTELQERTAPDPAVWTRIHNLVQAEREVARMQLGRAAAPAPAPVPSAAGSGGWLRSLVFWRSVALASVVATVLALVTGANLRDQLGGQIASLRTQLQAAPQIAYVAVLSDDKSAASMLVTFDPRTHNLVLQRVGSYHEAGDKSLQLWALPPAGGPRSLGVLGNDRVLRVNAAEGDIRQIPMLAISLEPKGGVPGAGGPTGPVLFKGPLVPNSL